MSRLRTPSNHDAGAIVVGVSPSSGSPTALRWALEEAGLRHLHLHAVTAWQPSFAPPGPVPRPSAFPPMLPEEIQARTQVALNEAVETALGEQSAVTCTVTRGRVANVLVEAAINAEFLVIGPPHRSLTEAVLPMRRFIQIIRRGPCVVVIMPSVPTVGRKRPWSASLP